MAPLGREEGALTAITLSLQAKISNRLPPLLLPFPGGKDFLVHSSVLSVCLPGSLFRARSVVKAAPGLKVDTGLRQGSQGGTEQSLCATEPGSEGGGAGGLGSWV